LGGRGNLTTAGDKGKRGRKQALVAHSGKKFKTQFVKKLGQGKREADVGSETASGHSDKAPKCPAGIGGAWMVPDRGAKRVMPGRRGWGL